MKIDFVGWFSRENCGDDCFQLVFAREFSNHDLNFVTPPNTPRADCDLVILGGGAVASPFYLNTLPKDKPLYALGIDLAYESEVELLKKLPFKEIYVRNNKDTLEMRKRLNCKIVAIPDIAFGITVNNRNKVSEYKKNNKKTLGVLVTDYVNPAIDRSFQKFSARSYNFKVNLADRLDRLSEKYEIILIPCSTMAYGDDRRMNLDLAAYMKHRSINIMENLQPQDMIDLISGLDMAICMRFHAHIFSLIGNIPFVSIDFTRKVKLLLEGTNLRDISVGKFEGDEFNIFSPEQIVEKAKQDKDFAKSANLYLAGMFKTIRSDWLQESV